MTYTFKLSRRIARLRPALAAALLATIGCADDSVFDPESSAPAPTFAAASFAGGIPFGTWTLPTEEFGSIFNGAHRIIYPQYLMRELAAIKARGGRVMIRLSYVDRYLKDASGHFDLNKWKAMVDKYRNLDFSSYINDGTIIGHYLLDEPHDPANWNGRPIPPATIEEMARHSKARWPGMATIIRTWPDYLDNYSASYRYLDAAWAHYAANRWPDPKAFVEDNVAKARAKGLALVVGLNIIDGSPTKGNMSPSQVRSYGTALLSSSYPCAFISWEYRESYMTASILDAMSDLRRLAQNRTIRTCSASSGSSTPPPPPEPEPEPEPEPTADALPFGLSETPANEYSARWTGALYKADPADLPSRLTQANGAGMKLIVMLAGAAESKNANGTFSLTRWKAQVDRYRNLSLGSHVASGVLYLHYLVEQPRCASCWGGSAISWETIEEMARYSKSIWPALPTTVRVTPSHLANASFRWTHLDAGWAQYNTRQGDLRSFLTSEVAKARLEGLGLVGGLNLIDGSRWDTAPMTAAQIREFGAVLVAEPSLCAVVGWKYDAVYLDQSGVSDALDAVAAAARSRRAASCVAG